MKRRLLDFLACPTCASDLTLSAEKEEGAEIIEGLLRCAKGHAWRIAGGVPRFLAPAAELSVLQQKTIRNFGDEWKTWDDFGWSDRGASDITIDIFRYKVLVEKGELAGKLVLDAGCGNGRYTKAARDFGGEVIGVDLSDAVDVAFRNMRDDDKIHIIQGDLFKLPLKKGVFDFIFSNGVLMHTGDARRAFLSLVPHLKIDGAITVHLYHKGNLVYEFNDWWMRAITTRLPLSMMYKAANAFTWVTTRLPKTFVDYGLNIFFRAERHPHYVFDWYTAPIATHHTYPEVYGWLKEAGLYLTHDHNITRYPWRRFILPFQFLTVRAQRQKPLKDPEHTLR
ncbi:MAG: methyltransferase domain-containing protein [Candidatus Kaiserbacteria bacterium]|nr:MAG: methyltransferase domain-containing protein [Candidatus Kaiserbacteria bacterium]